MDDHRAMALLALSLVEGVSRGDEAAHEMLIETFDDLDQAARAHAYLAGYLMELLAAHRQEPLRDTARHVRRMIEPLG